GRAAPVTVSLADGAYTGPTTSGESVVLLDETRNMLLTYGSDGQRRAETTIPGEMKQPRLSRGEDARVYVDGSEGRQVLVVDHDGAVDQVPVVGEGAQRNAPPQREPEDRPQPQPGRDSTVAADPRTNP